MNANNVTNHDKHDNEGNNDETTIIVDSNIGEVVSE